MVFVNFSHPDAVAAGMAIAEAVKPGRKWEYIPLLYFDFDPRTAKAQLADVLEDITDPSFGNPHGAVFALNHDTLEDVSTK